MLGPEYSQLEKAIPADHARNSTAEEMLSEAFSSGAPAELRVLDFGCGSGSGLDVIRAALPQCRYFGIDIEDSPEVNARIRSDGDFRTFDGVTLPFDDDSFDLVYSRQVFEHVRHPDDVVREIRRVLAPGGLFLGSMSNLEPYHSFSIFNYTPYGVHRILHDNGFDLLVMRPGPEGVSLIVRQLTMRRIGRFGMAYPVIRLAALVKRWDARRVNYLKLRFSGHICFIAKKGDA